MHLEIIVTIARVDCENPLKMVNLQAFKEWILEKTTKIIESFNLNVDFK